MRDKAYEYPRIVRFDETKVYSTIVGSVLWALTCGLLMAVYFHDRGTNAASWRLIIAFGFLAAIAPVTAYKNHPHAWPTFYTVILLMLMYASMMAR